MRVHELVGARGLRQLAGIDPVTLVPVLEQRDLPRIADHKIGNTRLEQIVQPRRPGSLLERQAQSAAQSCKELKNGRRLCLQDGFHQQLPVESITATEMVA